MRHTTFHEVMTGTVRLGGDCSPMRLELRANLPEVFRPWGDTEGALRGRVHVAGWADDAAATGTLRVAPIAARRIRYRLAFTTTEGRPVHLDGWKSISYRHPARSMTYLPATLTDEEGEVLGEARLHFDLRHDLAGFLAGLRLPRTPSPPGAFPPRPIPADEGEVRRRAHIRRGAGRLPAALRLRDSGRQDGPRDREGLSGPGGSDRGEDLLRSRWRGQPGRLEVWYTTLTDPASGTGVWIHHELVAPADGAPPHAHGWAAVFPPGGPPVLARFGPHPWTAPEPPGRRGVPGTHRDQAGPSPSPAPGAEPPTDRAHGHASPAGIAPASADRTHDRPPSPTRTADGQGASSPAHVPGAEADIDRRGGEGPVYRVPEVELSGARLSGRAGEMSWDLAVSGGGAPLFTFPRWAWRREVLPAAQVVAAPSAVFDGTVRWGERVLEVRSAPGATARTYGHGHAERWAWLHADLGDGDVCEVVAAVSTRPGLHRLRPLPFVRLRAGGLDWPSGDGLLAATRMRARVGLPSWTVSGRSGDRMVRIEVTQPPAETVAVDYADPDGSPAVCHNTERADAVITLLRRSGRRWELDRRWHLNGTAHAEVGLR